MAGGQARGALITGASGFIGRALSGRLKEKGRAVHALMRTYADGPWDECVVADVAGEIPVNILHNVDTVFHLAGKAHALSETRQDESEYFYINTEGTRRLLDAAREAGVRRFIFFSSVKAMGEGGDVCLDESAACCPETPYGKSKLEAERLVLEGGYVPEPVVLRLSMVYGPTRKGNLPRMIEAVARGRFPPLPDIHNHRSMVHVDDVVAAALLAAEKTEATGQTYIVTDDTPYSTRQMYEWICEVLGKQAPSWCVPMGVLKMLARVGDGIGVIRGRRFMFDSDALEKLTGSAWYSSEKIEKELGFLPERNLRDSLPEIIGRGKGGKSGFTRI